METPKEKKGYLFDIIPSSIQYHCDLFKMGNVKIAPGKLPEKSRPFHPVGRFCPCEEEQSSRSPSGSQELVSEALRYDLRRVVPDLTDFTSPLFSEAL